MSNSLINRIAARRKDKAGVPAVTPALTGSTPEPTGAEPPPKTTTTDSDVVRNGFNESRQDQAAVVVLLDEIDVTDNVRTAIPDESIAELAEDIATHGQLQPVVVERAGPRFRLAAGERRYRAKRLLQQRDPIEHASIRATVKPTNLEGAQRVLLQLSENIQREDLNPIDTARAIDQAMGALDLNQKEMAARLHKPPSWVTRHLNLLKLNSDLQAAIVSGDHSMASANKAQAERLKTPTGTDAERGPGADGASSSSPAKRTAKPVRVPTAQVPVEQLVQICEIYAVLAKQHDLPAIALPKKPTRRELLTVLAQRTSEMRDVLTR